MFARSGSSIKDQALYTPVRAEHLKELSNYLVKLPNHKNFVPFKVKLLELILAVFTSIKGFYIAQFST